MLSPPKLPIPLEPKQSNWRLNKREFMALEITKALIGNLGSNWEPLNYIPINAVQIADDIIEQCKE